MLQRGRCPGFFKYLHKILELNPLDKFARVEPGIVLDDLRAEASSIISRSRPILQRTIIAHWAA